MTNTMYCILAYVSSKWPLPNLFFFYSNLIEWCNMWRLDTILNNTYGDYICKLHPELGLHQPHQQDFSIRVSQSSYTVLQSPALNHEHTWICYAGENMLNIFHKGNLWFAFTLSCCAVWVWLFLYLFIPKSLFYL